MNSFFEVDMPFRYYRLVGKSLSNSWVGSSRAINSVYEAVNAKPGRQFHALVGGLFTIDDASGAGAEARLTPPKPIFEKTYLHVSDAEQLRGLAKKGLVREIREPAAKTDYVAIRKACDVDLRPLHPEIVQKEASPELQAFRRVFATSLGELTDAGIVCEQYDHVHDPIVGFRLTDPSGATARVEWAFIPNFYRITHKADAFPSLAPLVGERSSLDDVLTALSAVADPASEFPAVAP